MPKIALFFLILGLTQASAVLSSWKLNTCKRWNCINNELGFDMSENRTIPRAQVENYLQQQLPEVWEDTIKKTLDICFKDNKPRVYSNLCPGQQMWHCIVDQLLQNCPNELTKVEDSCNLVGSLSGSDHFFYQTVYQGNVNSSQNKDHRPAYFLRSVFKSKCCALPDLFHHRAMDACNVTSFLKHVHFKPAPAPRSAGEITQAYCAQNFESVNPFECCDMSDIFKPESFDLCSLHVEWRKGKGFVTADRPDPMALKTIQLPPKKHITFVKVAPEAAKPLSCVFAKLNISTKGEINKKNFDHLLGNMTHKHPEWKLAKSKVAHRCYERDLKFEYDGTPEQRLLACAIDVLAENCPHGKKGLADPCRHVSPFAKHAMCEISNSKFRHPAYHYCDIPRLVAQKTLEECGLISLTRMEVTKPKDHPPKKFVPSLSHQNQSEAAKCVLNKMDALRNNETNSAKLSEYLDKAFNKNRFWSVVRDRVISEAEATVGGLEGVTKSTEQLLSLIEATVSNCPVVKRKYTNKCARFYGYQTKCANRTTSDPPRRLFTPLKLTPVLPANRIYNPITHTITSYPRYAPDYSHYVPKITLPSYNLNIPKFYDPNAIEIPKIIDSPLISHVYAPNIAYTHTKYELPSMYNVKPIFRTGEPFFPHVSIADVQKSKEPTKLEHPFPVEGQVYV